MSDIIAAIMFVLAGGWERRCPGRLRLLVQSLKKGPTPTATGSGSEALAELGTAHRLFDSNPIFDFSSRNVKAETYFVVGLHVDTGV